MRFSGKRPNSDVVPTKVGNRIFVDPGFRRDDEKAQSGNNLIEQP